MRHHSTSATGHEDTEIGTVHDRNGERLRIAVEESDGRRYVTAGRDDGDPIELAHDDLLATIETLTRAARTMSEWQ